MNKAQEMSRARVAFALLCGLALCCSVMYITADGDEVVLTNAPDYNGGPTAVETQDVQKASIIFTNTPDGRMRLTDYLTNVEKEIEAEEAARHRDVEAVRAQMARNFAFNKAARAKLNSALIAKMAANAKAAKQHLHKAMAFVQKKFAQAEALQNKRHALEDKQALEAKKEIEANKQEAAKQLKTAVRAQQTAMATLTDKMHARIKSTDKAVSKNSAQIVANAKAAHKALEEQVGHFDQKVKAAAAGAAAGRSKLLADLKNQDKKIRESVANKLKAATMRIAQQFDKVQKQMAADRAHADQALASASGKMKASLNAEAALRDEQFKKTVDDIAAAKKEATERVNAAKLEFKSKILKLRATVNTQVTSSKNRMTQLTGKVEKARLAQAKVNANVAAEQKRMEKLGNERYEEHLKKDAALKGIIEKNKADTDSRMAQMSAHYTMELDAVRSTMKKNRAHASKMLAKKTSALYDAIAKSEKEQHAVNEGLAAATKQAKRQIADALREAKDDFSHRLGALSTEVANNDKKFEKKMKHLTGIVNTNRENAKNDREAIADLQAANKADLQAAVADAIHQGENRMMAAEQKLKDMNEKSKTALNMRVTAEITKLKDRAHGQIEDLRLSSKEARDEMRKELLEAVRDSAKEAKDNLAAAVAKAKVAFADAEAKEDAAAKAATEARDKLATDIATEKEAAATALADGVASLERSLLALKTSTKTKIDKANNKVDAYAAALKKESEDVKALMAADMAKLTGQIASQEEAASSATTAAAAASEAASKKINKQIADSLASAKEASDAKFASLITRMSEDRQAVDKALAGAVTNMNAGIAKQAALADARFSKTVKDIEAARKQAKAEVAAARKNFATELYDVSAKVKDQETRLSGEIAIVATVVVTQKAEQLKINRRLKAEHERILKLVNDNHSESVKARGQIRRTLDEYKQAAAEETASLDKTFSNKVKAIRRTAAHNSASAAKDLSKASEKMYGKLAKQAIENAKANEGHAADIAKYAADAAAAISDTKKQVNTQLNQLTNVMASNAEKQKRQLEVLTGVINSNAAGDEADRALLRKQTAAMGVDINKRIVRAIQTGEARAKGVAEVAAANLDKTKKTMLVEISQTVEATADNLFETIQGNHKVLADNYLSLKAYGVAAGDKVDEYVGKGKGKNLSSLGDILSTIAGLADVNVPKTDGIAAGADSIPAIFSSKSVPVKNSVSKINGLVSEYTSVTNQVRQRWPLGLGKYLLKKLEESMLEKGVLQVDKIEGKDGNYVFLNGHAVGLSNKLNDFEDLAITMPVYEKKLAKITASLTAGTVKHASPGASNAKLEYANAPEWNGK
jgi:hypothetical protein